MTKRILKTDTDITFEGNGIVGLDFTPHLCIWASGKGHDGRVELFSATLTLTQTKDLYAWLGDWLKEREAKR